MHIDIPNEQYQALAERARAAGYADVPGLIKALATEPIDDPRGDLSAEELAESVGVLRESEADIAAGRVRPLRDALTQIAEKHGLSIDR
jgi:hypothetical protein